MGYSELKVIKNGSDVPESALTSFDDSCYTFQMSSVKNITFLNYFICLIGFVAEFFFASHLNPKENSVFIFLIVWGSLPILTLLLFLIKTPRILHFLKMSLFQISTIIGIGMIFKIYLIYIRPDPLGAIALAPIPIVQIIGALFIGLIIKMSVKKYYASLAAQDEIEQ